jgi:outer membrane protein OmpA-like peptidoglycan-associated protein
MHHLFEAYRMVSELSEQPVQLSANGRLRKFLPVANTNAMTPNANGFMVNGAFKPVNSFNQVVITPAGHLDLNENILFEFDKATLKPAGQQVIQRIAQQILRLNNANIQVNVVGYTDLYGGTSYNQQLGMSRAQAVSEALQQAGVTKVSAKTGGMKNAKVPLQYDIVNGKAPAQGIQQQQPNRRVEIEFNPPLPKQIMNAFITNMQPK